MHSAKTRKISKMILFSLTLSFIMTLFLSMTVFAVTEEQAQKNLTIYVQGKMMNKDYSLDGGGSVKGKDLFSGSNANGFDLSEAQFGKLSSKAQSEVVADIANYSNEAVETQSSKGIEESTVNNWWKELQTKEGVGSKFLNEILKNTKPDFVSANKFWEPFNGPIGIALGIFAVGIMICLGFVIVMDLFYIGIPPFRMLVSENGDNGKVKTSNLVSHDAIWAVEQAENNNDANSGRQALGLYMKKRIIMLVFMGIALLYLVQGQIYVFVGYILDIVSGTLGF